MVSSNTMKANITIDRAGRVVIPKAIRDSLRLEPGDSLEIEATPDEIRLKPVHETQPLVRENGMWVFRTGKSVSTETLLELIDRVRDERMDMLLK